MPLCMYERLTTGTPVASTWRASLRCKCVARSVHVGKKIYKMWSFLQGSHVCLCCLLSNGYMLGHIPSAPCPHNTLLHAKQTPCYVFITVLYLGTDLNQQPRLDSRKMCCTPKLPLIFLSALHKYRDERTHTLSPSVKYHAHIYILYYKLPLRRVLKYYSGKREKRCPHISCGQRFSLLIN